MGFNRPARAAVTSLALLAGCALWTGSADAAGTQTVTAKECHARFKAAKSGGTLAADQKTYKAFKTAQCGGAEAESSKDEAADDAAPAPSPDAEEKPAASTKSASATPVAAGSAVFPSQVSSKYSSLSAGRARMKTCADQYRANKSSGGNGGLVWIKKGGGYWSECNKRLKGA